MAETESGLKIAYVITRSDVIGGAGVHLLDLAEGARQAGHEVIILAGGQGVLALQAQARGIAYVPLKHLYRRLSLLQDVLGFLELRKLLRSIAPDLIHLHSSKAGVLGRLAAHQLAIPVVFTAHGWAFTEGVAAPLRLIYRSIEKLFAGLTDRIITVSEYDRQLALRMKVGTADQITTVHNGMPDVVVPDRQIEPGQVVRMIMVARFDEQKDQAFLLQALSLVKSSEWTLELVGDGPLLETVRQQAVQTGLSQRVTFSGQCTDIPQRLARADIFLLISNWEGLPLTIIEAMRASLPVIASDVGGVAELVQDGETGFLHARGNRQVLVEAINLLLGSAAQRQRMGCAGRALYQTQFTGQQMLAATLDIYAQVIRGHR